MLRLRRVGDLATLFGRAYRLVRSDIPSAHSATADSLDWGITASATEVSDSEGVDLVAGAAVGADLV
jgi:hypothetical protein